MRRLVACVTVLALCPVTAACGGSGGPVTLTVLAASSLTEAFEELAGAYRRAQPDVRVRLALSGSQDLLERLREREPADVLVTADRPTMERGAEYVAGPGRIIAGNSMTIAVAPGNPRRIRRLADLDRRGLRVVLGGPQVPAGRYARQVLGKAGVRVRAAEEISARAVLDRVRTGEADAGIVYITDMRAAGAAAGSVPIPAKLNVVAEYPAAPVRSSGHRDEAAALVAWLSSPAAQQVLRRHGFTAPN